jgi:hypothetical protein
MVRRGVVVGGLLLVAACSDPGTPQVTQTTVQAAPAPAPVAPTDAEPGTGVLVLGRQSFELRVDECALEPTTDAATGVTTDVSVAASGDGGVRVTAVRRTFTAATVTVTDTVDYIVDDGGGLLAEAERVDSGGRILDLRDPAASGRLLDVIDGSLVVAKGRFGDPVARGPGPTDVDGELVLRCP